VRVTKRPANKPDAWTNLGPKRPLSGLSGRVVPIIGAFDKWE
jgi:hypothetical protein